MSTYATELAAIMSASRENRRVAWDLYARDLARAAMPGDAISYEDAEEMAEPCWHSLRTAATHRDLDLVDTGRGWLFVEREPS